MICRTTFHTVIYFEICKRKKKKRIGRLIPVPSSLEPELFFTLLIFRVNIRCIDSVLDYTRVILGEGCFIMNEAGTTHYVAVSEKSWKPIPIILEGS